ncbi:hypothetical protein [Embleya scabrispora]|uniref:hypothetical protein n=1 Tax=Embleya scabrispora TaxID=159449 RepID=UPI000365AB70|nr:hypothetical protein [Embleya scabrispora]MYS85549.1 hypothetical protein [Streptomyces sp. SID5474]
MSTTSTPEAAAWAAALGELRRHLKVVRVAPRGPRRSPWRTYAFNLPETYPFHIADVPDNRAWARVAAEMMRRHNLERFEPRRYEAAPDGWFATTEYDSDPRGWANMAVDWIEFRVTEGHALLPQLDEVGWMAAAQCLRTSCWDMETREDERAIRAAETLLDRFGRRARYYVNDSPTPLAARDHDFVQCYNDLVGLGGGCIGLVVVSDDEVGMFWSAADD